MYSCGFSPSNFIRNIFLIIFNFRNRFPQIHFIDMFSSFYFTFWIFHFLYFHHFSLCNFFLSHLLTLLKFLFLSNLVFFSIFDIHFVTINLKITFEVSFFVKKYFLSLLRFEPKILRFAFKRRIILTTVTFFVRCFLFSFLIAQI